MVLCLATGDGFRSSSCDVAGDEACELSERGDCLVLYFSTGDIFRSSSSDSAGSSSTDSAGDAAAFALSLRGDFLGMRGDFRLGSIAAGGSMIWDNDNC